MGFMKRFLGNEKKYTVVIGEIQVDMNIQKSGNKYRAVDVKTLEKKNKDFFIDEELLHKIFQKKEGVINLNNPNFLRDRENKRFARSFQKVVDRNIGGVINGIKSSDKETLKNVINDVRDNKLKNEIIQKINTPDGFFMKQLQKIEKYYGERRVPTYMAEDFSYEEKKDKPKRKEKEVGVDQNTLFNQAFLNAFVELQEEVSRLQRAMIEQKTQEIGEESVKTKVDEQKTTQAAEIQETEQGKQKNQTNDDPFDYSKEIEKSKKNPEKKEKEKENIGEQEVKKSLSKEQKHHINDLYKAHKEYKTQMSSMGGMQREDYEGEYGINTLLKNFKDKISQENDPKKLTLIKNDAIHLMSESFSNAIAAKNSREGRVDVAIGENSGEQAVRDIGEKLGVDVETPQYSGIEKSFISEQVGDKNNHGEQSQSVYDSHYSGIDIPEAEFDPSLVEEYVKNAEKNKAIEEMENESHQKVQ